MTDRELLTELQTVLIEPPDGGDTWPSLIWTRAEVLDAVNAGIRALAHDTHIDVARVEILFGAAGDTVIVPDLPCDWLATAAVVWRAKSTGVRTPLGPTDRFEADLAMPGSISAATPGLPLGYLDRVGQRRTLELVPWPAESGTIELLYVRVPPEVLGTAPGTNLPLPEECATAVKYSALSTLLRKVGRLLDTERADYCDRRYDLDQTVAEIILNGWS